jgi:hypothetical protein
VYQKTIAIMACLAFSAVTHAANIFTLSGPSPFGFGGFALQMQSWNQTTTYTNVSITMPLADLSGPPIAGVEGTVYLMRQIGPGTTASSEVAPPVSITGLTNVSATRTLFSGLTLSPGNYYVVLVPTTSTPQSMSPFAASTPAIALGTGVTALGIGVGTPTSYPPASDFTVSLDENNLIINVSGDAAIAAQAPVATPSLNAVGILLLLLLMISMGLFASRRRTNVRTHK